MGGQRPRLHPPATLRRGFFECLPPGAVRVRAGQGDAAASTQHSAAGIGMASHHARGSTSSTTLDAFSPPLLLCNPALLSGPHTTSIACRFNQWAPRPQSTCHAATDSFIYWLGHFRRAIIPTTSSLRIQAVTALCDLSSPPTPRVLLPPNQDLRTKKGPQTGIRQKDRSVSEPC